MRIACTIICFLTLLLSVGCADNRINPPIEGRSDPYSPKQLQFVDPGLREQTAIGNIVVSTDTAGLLHIDVPVRCTIDMQTIIDYRVTFVDKNGVPLGPPTGWTALTLPPNVYQDIQVNSSSSRAADFRIDLRYAQ